MHIGACLFMNELLTTDEAATYLRLSERKLYELVGTGAVPCSKATGRWLFPKAALDRWVAAGMGMTGLAQTASPPIVGGSHDPLLEWALRESGSGLAGLPEGSEAGLRRLGRGEVLAAAIHLHHLEGDDDSANIEAVTHAPGLHDAVILAFARREQGLLVAPGNPLQLADVQSIAKRRARLARRPAGAGAQLLLLRVLAAVQIPIGQLAPGPVGATGPDVAQAVRAGRADCGVATRAVARAAGLDFVPITWERFDLVMRQRDYFLPGPQALFAFARSAALRARAAELGGYDVDDVGTVRLVK
jgi:putative molybdopterin biosynthesis protein